MHRTPDAGKRLSVLMSVYGEDVPEQLDAAIDSVVRQTRAPDEIVLVKDGPLTGGLESVFSMWQERCPGLFRSIALPCNVGLGLALKAGMEASSHEIIARMDADDLSVPDRFQKQMTFLERCPEIDVVSSWTAQFYRDPNEIHFVRRAPTAHEEIARLARFRSPITHAACMYRRAAVLKAGSYSDWPGLEDYELWARMLLAGSRFACIPEPLYKVRRGAGLANRRSGLKRACLQARLQKQFLEIGFVSWPRFLLNVTVRVVACLLPVGLMERLRTKLRI